MVRGALAWVMGLSLLAGCSDDDAMLAEGGSSSSSTSVGTSTSTSTSATATSSSTSGDDGSTTSEPVDPPPACGSLDYTWQGLLGGPADDHYDETLEQAALVRDRFHHAVATYPHGLAGDISIGVDQANARAAMESFLVSDSWDFEASQGGALEDLVTSWGKAAGSYAGVSAAADAFAYGTMRDQGYPCDDIDRARERLVRSLDGLHVAHEVTGTPGVLARAYAPKGWAGIGQVGTVPLFDGQGNPLPEPKNNGTWREDNSGMHPELVWEDSCSRDMIVGWVIGMAAAWEVIADDPTIDDAVKQRLQADAAAVGQMLMVVRDSGFDLEIQDADGRTTFHGHMHENNLEGDYVGFYNGFHAVMATGVVAGLAFVSEDPDVEAYLWDELIGSRNLVNIATQSLLIDFGVGTNYSTTNMAFASLWLAQRYLDDDELRESMHTIAQMLYDREGSEFPARAAAQSLFDFVFAATLADATADTDAAATFDSDAVARGTQTLHAFPPMPAWNYAVEHCDSDELSAEVCTLSDGTQVGLYLEGSWNDEPVADTPLPLELRPPSNYYWRSNPYQVNGGGDGSLISSGADFRVAYWLGRWTR